MASPLVPPPICVPCLGFETDDKPKSPFKCLENEIFFYKDVECVEKEAIRKARHDLTVFEKSTISSRARSRKGLKKLEEAVEKELQGEIVKDIPVLNWALTFAKFCQSDKTSLTEYISEQKELFLLEYALKVKRNTIAKMEKLAAREEKKAHIAEIKLEEDAVAFDEFLKENDRSSVEALKMAAQEAKHKMEVMSEVRMALGELVSLKSEITETENLLKQYVSYEAFLFSISPKQWQDKQIEKKRKRREKKRGSLSYVTMLANQKPKVHATTSFLLRQKLQKDTPGQPKEQGKKSVLSSPSVIPSDQTEKTPMDRRSSYRFFRRSSKLGIGKKLSLESRRKSLARIESEKSISSEEDFILDDLDSDEEPEIYFKEPEDLLKMFTELEEQNLSLYENIQEISGTLEDHYLKERAIKEEKEKTIKNLVNEKDKLIALSMKEEEKREEVAFRANMFSAEYNPQEMDKLLNSLNKKIAEVYNATFGSGDAAASLTSFQMLKRVENRVSELSEMLETLPTEYLDTIQVIEKLRAKERRQRLREQKLADLKRIQEQRLKAALARAIAAPKKTVGRKLVFRSQPPETKQGEKNAVDLGAKSEDDYYFT